MKRKRNEDDRFWKTESFFERLLNTRSWSWKTYTITLVGLFAILLVLGVWGSPDLASTHPVIR